MYIYIYICIYIYDFIDLVDDVLDENNPFNNKIKTKDIYTEDNLFDDTHSQIDQDVLTSQMDQKKKKLQTQKEKTYLLIEK